MVEEYLKPDYAPEAVAARCGVTALRIRQLAAELAAVAFDAGNSRSTGHGPISAATNMGHARPPGQLSRHARHFGPFQRLPDRPRAASLQIILGHWKPPAATG
jgi:hypothetical protein